MEDKLKTLTSLAILKVDLDTGERDYIDYLISFATYCLGKYKPHPVTESELSDLLLAEFGLKIPLKGCQLVLRRLKRQGYLKKEDHLFSIAKELPKITFESKRNDALRDIERVYKRLHLYVKDEFSEEWDEEQISGAIITFLSRFGIAFLRAYIFNTALPKIPETAPKEQFIISKFISSLYECGDSLFESIVILVKGQMYANALVCPDLESMQKKFNNVTFFFDTPLILNLLGIQRSDEMEATKELVFLLKQLKGRVAVFEHTVLEIHNILSYVETNIDNSRSDGAVLREIRRKGLTKTDIILQRENLEEELFGLGISIRPTPEYSSDFQISETEFEEAINKLITYKNPEALKFDINSVRSIYELRSGKMPKRLEDVEAVFVTGNVFIAKAAFEIGKSHNSTREVSSVITDFSLANIAWLKAPLGAPSLPTKELLANCYAAMEPSGKLWHKYLDQIEKIEQIGKISSDDHALLRISLLAENELMNLTMGEESALNNESIYTILERVKTSLTTEKDEIIDQEKKKLENVCKERDCLNSDNQIITKNLFWATQKIAWFVKKILEAISGIILLAAIFLTTYIPFPDFIGNQFVKFILHFIIIAGSIFGFMNWYKGISLLSLLSKLENYIHKKIFSYANKKLKKGTNT